MRKWIFALLLFVFVAPIVCQAAAPANVRDQLATLSGQVVNDAGEPLKGGIVSFFDTKKVLIET